MSGNVDSEFVGESKRQRIPLGTRNDGEYNDVTVRRIFFLGGGKGGGSIVVIHIHQNFYL